MGKTRAQYQREYRERKKQNDNNYLKKERERTKRYKSSIDTLSEGMKIELREKNKLWKRQSRERQRIHNQLQHLNEHHEEHTHDIETQTSSSKQNVSLRNVGSQHMTVRLDFHHKEKSKRRSRALREASRKAFTLKEQLAKLTRENNKVRKQNQRLKKANKNTTVGVDPDRNSINTSCMTPKSKTNKELREQGISPEKMPTHIRKRLILTNALIAEIKTSNKKNITRKKRRVVANIVSGNIVRKYNCLKMMSKETGMSRKALTGARSKTVIAVTRRRRVLEKERIKRHVIEFLHRDDVSVNMPGKNDCIKTKDGDIKEKQQVRVLTDYMSNLYDKFSSERSDLRVSRSVFCRLRPKNILLTKLITRNTCLCSRHQNIAMKLKCMRSLGIDISPNPETVSKNVTEDGMRDKLEDGLQNTDEVEFEEWKRVTEADGKKKMKIVRTKMQICDFKTHMGQQYKDFLHHVTRVNTQYKAIKDLKTNLPENEVLVHMDFAENFTCCNADEVQSAYWNSTSVTLHPVVAYFRKEQEVTHKNFIFVSNVTNHNSSAVFAILKKLVPELKSLLPELKMVHYWTDSPSSQYRNRYMIDIVHHHKDIFGFTARWNYFESGHGKGPCDGIGGVAKRQAGEACKQGKVNIQDAAEFYQYATSQKKSIEYVFYSDDDYTSAAKELETRNPQTISGTMKLHAVFPANGTLYTAEVSCYCDECLKGRPCSQWKVEVMKPNNESSGGHNRKRKSNESSNESRENVKVMRRESAESESVQETSNAEVGDHALVNWEGDIYPGKVLDIFGNKDRAKISFMEETMKKVDGRTIFKWPGRPDVQEVSYDQIVRKIAEPLACSKSRRQFKLQDDDYCYLDSDSE